MFAYPFLNAASRSGKFRLISSAFVLTCLTACQPPAEEELGAELAPNPVQAISVQLATAEMLSLAEPVSLTGTLEAFKKATVAAEVSGQVLTRHVEVGDTVSQGQSLVTLDASLLQQRASETRANVATQQVGVASAASEYKRGKELLSRDFISKDQLEQLEFALQRAKAQLQAARAADGQTSESLRDADVSAPFTGIVEAVHVQQGDFLNPGTAVAVVADFSRMRVRAGVTASQAQQFVVGGLVSLNIQDAPDSLISGTIRSIGRISDPNTGAYPLEIWLEGEQLGGLRDGMIATVSLAEQDQPPVLAIPSQALVKRSGVYNVFVLRSEAGDLHRAHLQAVRVGRRSSRFSQILSGLSTGDRVVVDGQFALQDGAAVSF